MVGYGGRVPPSDSHPTAFISYAFSSSSRDRRDLERWRKTVLDFAILLCGLGIDADVDQFYEHDARVDWSRFGTKAAREKDFVLLAVSPEYRERWEGRNPPDEGPGSVREIDELMGQFDADQQRFRTRVHVVVLPGADVQDVPAQLRGLHRTVLLELSPAAVEPLYRVLTGQPATPKPAIGPLRRLPPRALDQQQEEAISEAEKSVGDLAREVADLRIDLARVHGALDSIPVDAREGKSKDGTQPPQARVAQRLEEESHAIHSRLQELQVRAGSAKPAHGFADRLDAAIARPRYQALGVLAAVGAIVALVAGAGWAFILIAGLVLAAGVAVGAGLSPGAVDRILCGAAALAVFEIAYEAFSVVMVGAVVLAVASGVLVVGRGARAVGAGAVAIAVLGLSIYSAVASDDPGSASRGESASPTATATASVAASASATTAPSEVTAQSTATASNPDCAGPALTGSERETAPEAPSNNSPDASDGPLAGGVAVRGETRTLNDEDWLHFCPATDRVAVRLISLTVDADCDGLHADLQPSGVDPDAEPLTVLEPDAGTVARADADVTSGDLYRVRITADGERCGWLLDVGPPGTLVGDPAASTTVPCVADEEASAGGREAGLEPNEGIDQVVRIAEGAFKERQVDGASRFQAAGALANSTDAEWFAFCSGPEPREVVITLRNVDQDVDSYPEVCRSVSLALLADDGRELSSADPADAESAEGEVAWTTEPNKRYYVFVGHEDAERCRWRLTAGPRSALSDTLPIEAWNG